MANITEFDAPLDRVQPTDRAADSAREAGATINRFGREAGEALGRGIGVFGPPLQRMADEAEAHQVSAMIGHGSAVSTALMGDLSQKWNQTAASADPNNTAIGAGFKEKMLEPALEEFQKQFENSPEKVQEWARGTADRMREHFTTRVAADEGIRAGVAVQQNVFDTHRNLSVMVGNDPSALNDASAMLDANVKALVGSHVNLSAGDAARITAELPKWKTELAKSAADGLIERDPQAAMKAISRGDFNKYLDGTQQAQLMKQAETAQKLKDADAKRDSLQAKQDQRDASADRAEDYRSKMFDAGTGRVLPVQPKLNAQIYKDMKDGSLTRADGLALIRWNATSYQSQKREDKMLAEGAPVRSDPAILNDLRKRVGDTVNPTTRQEIMDAAGSDKLSTKDMHDLGWRIGQSDAAWQSVQRQFKPQMATVERAIKDSIDGKVDPMETAQRINQLEADAQAKLRAAYATKDPKAIADALNPNSPNYVLSHAVARPAAQTLQEGGDKVRAAGRIAPAAGTVRDGFRFKGGNPADQANWEKI